MTQSKVFRAELKDRDWVELQVDLEGSQILSAKIKGMGCPELLHQIKHVRENLSGDIEKVLLPEGESHGALLLREVLLKAQGKWDFPYKDDELCHCRVIPTEVVDGAIVDGARTPEDVARKTSAGTGCGTCRTDTQNIIDFRLMKKKN